MVDPLAAQPASAAERPVWSVAALVHAVSDALAARFAACSVSGEIGGFSRAASGHCYFTLKDAEGQAASIRCAMFRRAASLLDFNPADGQRVQVRGRVAVYEPRGELQFVVESMLRGGAGALFEQFLRLKARLEAEGLFDSARKRPLPVFPLRVGVVTSLGAAALHDVATSFARRAPHVTLIVYPSLVQGAQAPAELVAAIALAGRRDEVDLLIVCRGGGSLEDLWAFNDEGVVRAIAACPLPVLCGVGHQTDVTLADFAADVRAPTPTAAAELAAPATQDCVDALHAVADAMRQRVLRALDTRRQRLDHVALRLSRPAVALRRRAQRLAMLRQRLDAALRHATAMHAQRERQAAQRLRRAVGVLRRSQALRLAGMASRLEALDPGRVLHRGYAWLTDEQGVALVSASRVLPGQEINAVLADGRVVARVLGVELDPPARR